MTEDKYHQDCPDCGHKGCRTEFADGGHYCHSCGSKSGGKKVDIDLPTGQKVGTLKERNISRDTCEKFKVSIDQEPYKHYYPYYEVKQDGTVGGKIAVKVRVVDNKDFYANGKLSNAGLFGQNVFPPGTGKAITIVEGECDAMAVYELSGGFPVVSVKNAQTAYKDCKRPEIYNYLNSFQRVYLAFDMDDAGQAAVSKVADLFEPGKVFHVKMTRKDANEYLKDNDFDGWKKDWWAAQKITPDGLVSGDEMWELVSSNNDLDIIPYPWADLNKLTYGLRLSEMVTITAGSGMGKTQVLRELQYHFLRNTDYNIGCLMMEEPLKSAGLGVMSVHANKLLHLPRREFVDKLIDKFGDIFSDVAAPDVTDKELKDAYDATLGTGRIHFYDSFGSNTVDNIIARIRFMAKALDCKIIFLDHISILVSDQQSGDERKALDEIATKLKTLTVELNIALVMVSHAKRQATKPLEEGGSTSLADIRGTAGIGQLSNIVLGLERDGQAENKIDRNTTLLRVIKNRFTGLTGPSSSLYYNSETGRLKEVTPEDIEIMKELPDEASV